MEYIFVGQPDNHVGWATSLVYTWDHSTYQRTIFWNFGEKMLKIGGFEKMTCLKQANSKMVFRGECSISLVGPKT